MHPTIKQFIDDSWYENLERSGNFRYTEAVVDYVQLFSWNLQGAADMEEDTHSTLGGRTQTARLLNDDFEFVYGEEEYQIFYKPGRLVTKIDNRLSMVYQYKGVPPVLLTKNPTLRLDYDVFSDVFHQSNCVNSINHKMEEDGEFIEPWHTGRFSKEVREILADLLDLIPDSFSKRLFSA